MMDIVTYKAAFERFKSELQRGQQSWGFFMWEKNVNNIYVEAETFYRRNSKESESDYQAKINIFLNFNRELNRVNKDFCSRPGFFKNYVSLDEDPKPCIRLDNH